MSIHQYTPCADTPQLSPSHRSSTSSNSSQKHIRATLIPHHAMPQRPLECVSSEKTNPSTQTGVLDKALGWLAKKVARISKPTPRSAPSLHSSLNSINLSHVPTPQRISLSAWIGPAVSTPPASLYLEGST
ncbi:hypothetical protein OG21DRAFT_1249433 [Imleria badia]|nr:hypothetical protein OG21DRAFT_1249433 [Imleria badia]